MALPDRLIKTGIVGTAGGAMLWVFFLFWVAVATANNALDDGGSRQLAANAYQSIQAAGGGGQLPQTRSADAKAIGLIHPYQVKANGSHAAGYHWVKTHGNAVFVEQADSQRVVLYAHESGQGVARLTGDSAGDTDILTAWTGTMAWWLMRDIAEGEVALLALIMVLLSLESGYRQQARHRQTRRLRRSRQQAWREVVGDSEAIGPRAPEEGFALFVAQFEEHGEGPTCATFRVVRREWYNDDWYEMASGALAAEQIPRGTPLPEISERWFDYCKRVSDLNTQAWAPERARRAELAAAEQQIAEVGGLEGLLTPGHQLARSIAEESSALPS